MNKLRQAYEWALTIQSSTITFFTLAVWLPFSVLMLVQYVMPWMDEYWQTSSMITATLMMGWVYFVFLPLIFDLLKDHINAKRRAR